MISAEQVLAGAQARPHTGQRDCEMILPIFPGFAAKSKADPLKRLQGGLFFFLDIEQLVQLGDLEDLVDRRIDVA